jgi:hypothetical protein
MSGKAKGCIWCDQLRKKSRKVKASKDPRWHWVLVDRGTFTQKECQKASR